MAAALVINASFFEFDRKTVLTVGELPYGDEKALRDCQDSLRGSHVVRRSGDKIWVAQSSPNSKLVGEPIKVKAYEALHIVTSLLEDWLIEHFSLRSRRFFRRRRCLVLISKLLQHDLLEKAVNGKFTLPAWVGFRCATEFQVATEYVCSQNEVLLTTDTSSRPILDGTVSELMAMGVPVEGLYVCTHKLSLDGRMGLTNSLLGQIASVQNGIIHLADHGDNPATVDCNEAYLEPRLEVLAHVIRALNPRMGSTERVLEILREVSAPVRSGPQRRKSAEEMAKYFQAKELSSCLRIWKGALEHLLTIVGGLFHRRQY